MYQMLHERDWLALYRIDAQLNQILRKSVPVVIFRKHRQRLDLDDNSSWERNNEYDE
jgi:hypothetical protein